MGLFDFFKRTPERNYGQVYRPDSFVVARQAKATTPTPARSRPAPETRAGNRVVMPDNTPLHVKRKWTRKGNTYTGYYRTKYGAYPGEISQIGDEFRIYIFSPPMEKIDFHPKRPCFSAREKDRWYINLYQQPRNGSVDDCIWYVEQLLIEAHTGTFKEEQFAGLGF